MGEPKLRFKADDGSEFPAWEKKTLGDLGVFVRGLTYDKTQTVETNGVAVMRSNNISSDGTLDYENGVQLVSKEPSEEQLLRKNDIVICMANGSDRLVGKAAKYDGGYKEPSRITVGAFCGIFRSSAPALPWWFQSDEYQRFLYLGKQGGNGALANLKGKDIENISVMFPADIDEQRKIADCLSAVDAVIAAQQAEVDAWEQRKKGVMQKLFSQEVRFKADDGSDFPDWTKTRLNKLCEYRTNRGTGRNYIGTENMLKDFEGVAVENGESEGTGSLYEPGDTLMSNIRPYLKKVWTADCEGACSTDVLVFHPTNVVPDFLHYVIASDSFVTYVMSAAKGSKMPRGDKAHIMQMPVFAPDKDEQRKIADCLSSMDEAIQKSKDELAKWQELKKGLLQQMFM